MTFDPVLIHMQAFSSSEIAKSRIAAMENLFGQRYMYCVEP